jgi:hypothetical protein
LLNDVTRLLLQVYSIHRAGKCICEYYRGILIISLQDKFEGKLMHPFEVYPAKTLAGKKAGVCADIEGHEYKIMNASKF